MPVLVENRSPHLYVLHWHYETDSLIAVPVGILTAAMIPLPLVDIWRAVVQQTPEFMMLNCVQNVSISSRFSLTMSGTAVLRGLHAMLCHEFLVVCFLYPVTALKHYGLCKQFKFIKKCRRFLPACI